jgi:DNA-binding NtrC family response regulator
MNPNDLTRSVGPSQDGGVLLVDDEQALLDIYGAVLRTHFNIATALNAAAAEQLLKEKSFKVIVADHLMPGEAGLDFLTRVRVEYPHIKRVMVTGNMTAEMLQRATQTSLLFAFLIKPISIVELRSVVQSAVLAHDMPLAPTS